jgi:hypothetical protein
MRLVLMVAAAAAAAPLALAAGGPAAAAGPAPGLGTSVAVSGSIVVAGAPFWDHDRGEVIVASRHGSSWSRQAVLKPPGTGTSEFGYSVAISGSTIVVGAPKAARTGLVYIYVRSGTGWRRQAVLAARHRADGSGFGSSVGISGAVTVAASGRSKRNQAMLFRRTGTTWSRPTVLDGPLGSDTSAQPRAAVAVSGPDAVATWPGAGSSGQVLIYDPPSYLVSKWVPAWAWDVCLAGPPPASDGFGSSVAISGAVLAIGSTDRASIFTRAHGVWAVRARVPAVAGAEGISVAASASAVVAGASAAGPHGAAFIYQDIDHRWSAVATLASPHSQAGDFGAAVALSGGVLAVGNPGASGGRGAVLVYTGSGKHWVLRTEI